MCKLFIDVLYSNRRQGRFLLHEFVVMRNHFHVLLTVNSELSIERAVQYIKGGFSFRAKKQLGIAAEIWDKGRKNPVQEGLSQTPEAYPYGSAFPGYELDEPPQRLKPVTLVAAGRHD